MFEVCIDFSLFTKDAAFGRISGKLPLAIVPQVGDTIAFRMSRKVEAYVDGLPFVGHLRVAHRTIGADADFGVLLTFGDVTGATPEDARQLMAMFEEHYGLFGENWDFEFWGREFWGRRILGTWRN